jgi:hypothetical protein
MRSTGVVTMGNVKVFDRTIVSRLEFRMLVRERNRLTYGPPPDDGLPSLWVEAQYGSQVHAIENIEQFCSMVQHVSGVIDSEQAAGLARVACHLLDLGRVVEDIELYSFVQERFNLNLAENSPQFRQGRLS